MSKTNGRELPVENLGNDIAVHVGQAEIAACVTISQPLVIHAHQMQQRGMQIVNMNLIAGRIVTVLIGCPMDVSFFDPRTSQPHRIPLRIMIAAIFPLRDGSPSEFAAPHNQGIVQQSPLLQIRQQPGRWACRPFSNSVRDRFSSRCADPIYYFPARLQYIVPPLRQNDAPSDTADRSFRWFCHQCHTMPASLWFPNSDPSVQELPTAFGTPVHTN
ncbi:hypothetical protein PM8797T_15923 [Gimesia maris DSM 8797]|nr:hypothetical protein PM8797T_15923 [Gimesia maris DSM 8797]